MTDKNEELADLLLAEYVGSLDAREEALLLCFKESDREKVIEELKKEKLIHDYTNR